MSGPISRPRRAAPPPGQAPLPAENAAALLRANAADPTIAARPAVRFEDRVVTHGEYVAESCRWANLFLDRLPAGRPPHVAVLLDNLPEYLFAFGGAALSGAAVVGLNHTRRGEHLLRDIEHTHCGLVITEPKHRELLAPIADRLPPVLEVGSTLEAALADYDTTDPGLEPSVDTIWALIFTSGTSDSPKAVICSQRRLLVTGNRMGIIMDLGPDDIGYVCMPLFHSNAVQVGWAPSIVVRRERRAGPQVLRVGLVARRPPLRRHLLQLHRQAAGATSSRSRSTPTTPTTRCGSRSATRAHRRSSTSSPAGSAWRSSTRTARPRAGSRSTATRRSAPARSAS